MSIAGVIVWGVAYNLTVIFWLASNIGTTPLIGFISMLAAILVLCTNTIIICSIWFFIKDSFKYNLILFSIIFVN